MGIFDIFKTKKNKISLELLLQKRLEEPSYRADFYKRILLEDLIVITEKSNLESGTTILKEDTNISILSLENGMIPTFTTTDRIFDKNIINKKISYIQMKGLNLFEITKGATLILNPYSEFSKELLPSEIQQIINGTIITENHKQLTIKKDSEVLIGQPSEYPTEIINSLKILFSNRSNVKKAYLGWIYDSKSGEKAHYIFGIEADSDIQNLINEAGFIVKEFLSKTEFVDFIKIEKNEKFSKYFLESTKPFYIKK